MEARNRRAREVDLKLEDDEKSEALPLDVPE